MHQLHQASVPGWPMEEMHKMLGRAAERDKIQHKGLFALGKA